MTTNSLQANQSAVVAGLGTQTFNIVTAGNYNLSFKSFLPYQAAGGPTPSSLESVEATDITLVADVAGSLNSTYFTFNSADDLHQYYVWYNIDSAGVDPAPAGRTGIEVAGAADDTATTLATATRAAINASTAASYVTVSGATTHVILTDKQYGSATDAANGTASPGFSYSITQGSAGSPAVSELVVVVNQNSTELLRVGNPEPTAPIMSGGVEIQAAASDVITVVLSSISIADNLPNAVKTIINLFQGV